jgi:hypothetical protein
MFAAPRFFIDATDASLIEAVDYWAALLELEDYLAAYNATEHSPQSDWTAALIRQVIKSYGNADPDQRVTVQRNSSEIPQRKKVHRYKAFRPGGIGYVWYDLNINGLATDLTATFDIKAVSGDLVLALNDIHVM